MEEVLNKYKLKMWSEVRGKELCEYEVYANSEEEAIQKLSDGAFEDPVTPIDFQITDHDEDLIDTIEIIGCEERSIEF